MKNLLTFAVCVCVLLLMTLLSTSKSNAQSNVVHVNTIWTAPNGIISPICEANDLEAELEFFRNGPGPSTDIQFNLLFNLYYAEPIEIVGINPNDWFVENVPNQSNQRIVATATVPQSTQNNQGAVNYKITIKFRVTDFDPVSPTPSTFNLFNFIKLDDNTNVQLNKGYIVNQILNHEEGKIIPPPYLLSVLEDPFGNPFFGNSNTVYEPIYVPVRFDIDEDLDFIPLGENSLTKPEIHLNPNTEITISGFGTMVNMDETLITSCDADWQSITVSPGSTLEITNSTIENGINAIIMEPNSVLRLDNVTFRNCDVAIISNGTTVLDIKNCTFENCTNGIQINGDPIIQNFSNNTFDGCSSRCITIRDNSARVDIYPEEGNENRFVNSNEGIGVFNGSAHIQNNIFEDINKAIKISGSQDMKSIIKRNQIGFKQIGIEVAGSNFLAHYNDIGTSEAGHHAIDVLFSEDYTVEFNNIDAEETGVYTIFSSGEVHENRIGMNSAPAMGVDRFFGSDDVTDNIIHARYTPVRGNGTEGDLVKNNTMTSLKEGVIVIGGTTDNTIEHNEIDVPRNGALYINSMGNTITCNTITAGRDAIEVNQNSDEQDIIGNNLNGSDNDVLIQSVIGRQEHNGNIFNGEHITAEGDALGNINNSRFVVDNDPLFDEYDPEFPDPAEFKKPEPFTGNYGSCSLIGSPIGLKFQDPKYACNYLQRIESYKTTNPRFYWNAMYHMMRFYLLTIPSENWPVCITMNWNESLPCGLKDLVIKETDLKKSLSSESENNYENTEEIVETQLIELAEDVCTEELQTLWKDAYVFILKKIKGDTLLESEKNRLDEIARQCATEYGDAVHWARALASEYNDNDYTEYDEACETEIEPRRSENQKSQSVTYSISPNPANDFIRINSSSDGYHNLEIYNTEGIRIDNIQYVGHYIEYNVSELSSGIYYIKNEINSEIIKFIKL